MLLVWRLWALSLLKTLRWVNPPCPLVPGTYRKRGLGRGWGGEVRAGQQILIFLRNSTLMRMHGDPWEESWAQGFLELVRCPRRYAQWAGPAGAEDGRAGHSWRENHLSGHGAWGVHPRPPSGWASPEPLLPILLGTRLLSPSLEVWGLEERLTGPQAFADTGQANDFGSLSAKVPRLHTLPLEPGESHR